MGFEQYDEKYRVRSKKGGYCDIFSRCVDGSIMAIVNHHFFCTLELYVGFGKIWYASHDTLIHSRGVPYSRGALALLRVTNDTGHDVSISDII
jgi:hypothetical protein